MYDKANARLIASAPDLLAALEALASVNKPFMAKPIGAPGSEARAMQDAQIAAWEGALSAIAKAKGGVS